jgi:hypothetical protein
MTFEQVIEIFGLKASVQLWETREEIYDTPQSLSILAPFISNLV